MNNNKTKQNPSRAFQKPEVRDMTLHPRLRLARERFYKLDMRYEPDDYISAFYDWMTQSNERRHATMLEF